LDGNEGKDKTRHGNEKAIDKEEEKTNTSSSKMRWYFTIFAVVGELSVLWPAGVAKAVNDSKAALRQLEELQRHNRSMEGRGLYFAPYKRGQGFSTKSKRKKKRRKSIKNAYGCDN